MGGSISGTPISGFGLLKSAKDKLFGTGDAARRAARLQARQRNIQNAQASQLRIREAEEERRRKASSRASAASRNVQSAGRLVAAASSPRLPSRLGV